MPLIRIPKSWELPERMVTPELAFMNRRQFMKNLISAGLGMAAVSLTACNRSEAEVQTITSNLAEFPNLTQNPKFKDVGRAVTSEDFATRYNNFYEFGGTKSIWEAAQALPTENWSVEVTGLVNNPQTYDIDALMQKFPLEERVYRFRCVEAWAMVVPWVGFPMASLMKDVEPKDQAKFVRFTSFYDPKITKGPGFWALNYPWPYTEGLRIEEMANDLAFFAVGLYGKTLPKQNGAPLRAVIPWKYGFKGAKSIVKIEFLDQQPPTFWNVLAPNEYGFEANVNPEVPHPRWSQATERIVTNGSSSSWEKQPTLLYNGYEKYVGKLYS
ncbi:MAG: protein-methionine-sulfoxide reductase catalytic subunit MsrP [Oscillatoriales cyanobacterium RM2_1_1]|nr:protein-methionine-sulfoxide reductase catalytic subunit MsrP [Oscillatoriales cyanobacterium SM2_3_0]NJO44886.1 protein-methionine-sulfoxide reductase catalytic subunit MsrP [Oscillatoriales cyanobacterium RM2_1_1]